MPSSRSAAGPSIAAWCRSALPETPVAIQCPCGLVRARVAIENGKAGAVAFESVPAFAFALDAQVEVPGHGRVSLDIGYGGAFYAVLPAARFGLDVRTSPTRALVDAAAAVTEAARAQVPLAHPDDPDLAFLYGTILTDGADAWSEQPTANICVFAAREVDRSPTGSGVTARLALQHARGLIALGQSRNFESITGAIFTGKVLRETTLRRAPRRHRRSSRQSPLHRHRPLHPRTRRRNRPRLPAEVASGLFPSAPPAV